MTSRFLPIAAISVLLLLAPSARAEGATSPSVQVTPELTAEFRKDPDSFFFDLRHLEAIAVARNLISDEATPAPDKAAAFRVLGEVYAALGASQQAKAAFIELFSVDPKAELNPPAAYPPCVVKAFYEVKDSGPEKEEPAAAGAAEAAPHIHTIAIGPMDNQSPNLPGQKFDLDRFAAGLTQMVTSDLMPATSLRVVDRQRLDVLRGEIQLSNSGFSDPGQAVKAGRLLGAQSYLFGSLIMLPDGLVRIDLRLVETETGRVLLAESREKKVGDGSDLLKLENDVVMLVAKKLDDVVKGTGAPDGSVSKAARAALDSRKKQSDAALQIVDLTGAAILAEDAGHTDDALAFWNEVNRLEPANDLAKTRIVALETGQKYASLEETKR